MPDVTVIEENGFTPHYFLNSVADFDGNVISTLTTSAVLEPAFIGEIVVGGVIFSLLGYNLYDLMIQSTNGVISLENCIDKFVDCLELRGIRPWMICDDCLQNCPSSRYLE
jgi:hypothetical protein